MSIEPDHHFTKISYDLEMDLFRDKEEQKWVNFDDFFEALFASIQSIKRAYNESNQEEIISILQKFPLAPYFQNIIVLDAIFKENFIQILLDIILSIADDRFSTESHFTTKSIYDCNEINYQTGIITQRIDNPQSIDTLLSIQILFYLTQGSPCISKILSKFHFFENIFFCIPYFSLHELKFCLNIIGNIFLFSDHEYLIQVFKNNGIEKFIFIMKNFTDDSIREMCTYSIFTLCKSLPYSLLLSHMPSNDLYISKSDSSNSHNSYENENILFEEENPKSEYFLNEKNKNFQSSDLDPQIDFSTKEEEEQKDIYTTPLFLEKIITIIFDVLKISKNYEQFYMIHIIHYYCSDLIQALFFVHKQIVFLFSFFQTEIIEIVDDLIDIMFSFINKGHPDVVDEIISMLPLEKVLNRLQYNLRNLRIIDYLMEFFERFPDQISRFMESGLIDRIKIGEDFYDYKQKEKVAKLYSLLLQKCSVDQCIIILNPTTVAFLTDIIGNDDLELNTIIFDSLIDAQQKIVKIRSLEPLKQMILPDLSIYYSLEKCPGEIKTFLSNLGLLVS